MPVLRQFICARVAVAVFFFLLLSGTARATLFWEADTNRGLSVFPILNLAPGVISVAPDPLGQYGLVYKYFLPDTNSAFGKERCESSGTKNPSGEFLMSYNTDYYIGWRAMWNPMPINPGWVALFQMHGYGVTGQGAPLVLRCINGDGNIYMQNNPNGVNVDFWHTKFKTNVWQTFVVHVFLSTNPAVGYTEIWYNGVLQTNINGTTRWYGPTWDNVDGIWSDSYNKLKWGCYRSGAMDGKGDAIAYMSDAKVGSTYADVDPNGSGDFSMSTTPLSRFVAPGSGTNYTVSIGALAGFSTNVNLSISGLPTDASANFNPATVTNSGNSTLSVSTSGSTPSGNYSISVVGTSGTLAHTNTVTLVVAGFNIALSPSSRTVDAGMNTNFTVTVTTNDAFSGTVNLGVAGLPSGASANFSPSSLSASGTSTLTINTATNTPGGSYALTINGTNDSFALNTTATLVVNGLYANPGTLLWTASGADKDWFTSLNWTNPVADGNGPPGPNNNLIFTNAGTVISKLNVNNIVDNSASVLSLQYNQTANYHVTQIADGQTLNVATNLTAGTGTDLGAAGTLSAIIVGNGTLSMTNPNGIVIVRQGTGTGTGPWSQRATLDLTYLGNFNANLSRILVAADGANVAYNSRVVGTMYLAKTNTLVATGSTAPQIDIGENASNGAGANADPTNLTSYLYLGITNGIYADAMGIGRSKSAGVMMFNPNYTNGYDASVYLRGVSANRMATFSVGDESPLGGSNQRGAGVADFSGGTVDALMDTAYIGRSMNGNNTGTATSAAGVLTFNAGTMDVNILEVAYQTSSSGTGPGSMGTVNVNGTGQLTVNNMIELGHGSAALPLEQGTLNINGGTVQAANIIGGGGVAIINLNSGTLDLDGSGQIANVSTLTIGTNGINGLALLQNAASISVSNALTIASNGIISGSTFIIAPALTINGTISPGNDGAGAMTNSGATTFGTGGRFAVTMDDATVGSVSGWSFLKANGVINVQSTMANPFIIDVGTADDPAANFNSSSNYDWVIATGSSIANFATNKFAINHSQFQNDLGGGYFYLHTNGNSLVLSFTNPPPSPVTINVSADGNNFVFNGTNGRGGTPYYVLASTNLALPPSNWTVIATNYFDSHGNFNFTNPADPNTPQTFYLLQLQ